MKTLDEVIEQFEKQMEKGQAKILCVGTLDSIPDVLHYLRELQLFRKTPVMQGIHKAQEEYATYPVEDWNPPLDWKTLKTMEGKPVWVEWSEVIIGDYFQFHGWFLVEWINDNENEIIMQNKYGKRMIRHKNDNDWQAYRKERTDGKA